MSASVLGSSSAEFAVRIPFEPFAERSWRVSALPCCDNDLRTARHSGHERVCSPRSKPSISIVCSATMLASCSRLGQPVMAIPPILSTLHDRDAGTPMR